MWPHSLSLFQSRLKNGWRRGGFFKIVIEQLEVVASSDLVDRPTQLICISDIYLSTDKYKGHSRAIWSDSNKTNLALITSSAHPPPSSAHFFERSSKKPGSASVLFVNELQCFVRPPLASCTGNQKRQLLLAPTGALVVMTVLGKLSGAQFARTCSNRIDTWQIGPRTVGHRTIGPRKVEPRTVGPCGPVAQLFGVQFS